MLHLLRNNSPYTVIILFIFTLVVKWQALAYPQLALPTDGQMLYGGFFNAFSFILGNSAFGFTMLAVLMLFGQGIYLNNIVVRYKLFAKPAYHTAFLYIIFTSLFPAFSHFSVPLMLNWCLVICLDMFLGFHHSLHPRKHIYNAGFVLCIASLFHFPAVGYLALLFFSLALLRSFNVAEWVVGLLGYITPVYFFAGILFLVDKMGYIKLWPSFNMHAFTRLGFTGDNVGIVIGVVILFLTGLFALQGQMAKSSVFARRNWVIVLLYLFISLLVALFTDVSMYSKWILLMPPLSMVISHALYMEKNKWFSNFAFYFSLVFVFVCQLALNH